MQELTVGNIFTLASRNLINPPTDAELGEMILAASLEDIPQWYIRDSKEIPE